MRRLARILICLAVVAAPLVVGARSAEADTGGYPWANAVCLHTGSTTGACSNYDWGYRLANGIFDMYDDWSYAFRNCTSWVAWRLGNRNGYSMPSGAGHARDWDNFFTGRAPIDSNPAVGAIAQTDGAIGSYGHVAYVESVNAGSVTVSEYNQQGLGLYGTRTVPTSTFRYIHVKDIPTGNPFGNYESADGGLGTVRVAGWSADPDAPTAATQVHIYIGGPAGTPGAQGAAIVADVQRPDVGAALPGYGNSHGFDHVIPTSLRGVQQVCAYAITIGQGANVLLGCRTVAIGNPDPFGNFEEAAGGPGQVFVKGWSADPDAAATSAAVHVYIGGQAGTPGAEGHAITADVARPDVGAALPGYGDAHGFAHNVATSLMGPQQVCAYAINIAGQGNNVLLGCRDVIISPANTPPTASFITTPESGSAPLTISVDASTSTDGDGSVDTYAWDFGDGGTGSGPTGSHTYSSPGSYTITLTVTDNGGATATATHVVTATAPVDSVSVSLTGQLAYSASGPASTGGYEVSKNRDGSLHGVSGTATLANGAEFSVRATQFWILPMFTGTTTLSDTSAGVSLNTPILFGKVAMQAKTVSATHGWFDLRAWPWKSYSLAWSITDS